MHAGFFDVFHDAADDNVLAVGEGIDVDFGGFFEELVNQDWARGAHHGGLCDVFLHGVDVVGDDHGAAAEDVARTDEHGQPNFAGNAGGFFRHECGAIARLRDAQFLEQAPETAAVFGEVDRLRGCADDRHTVSL